MFFSRRLGKKSDFKDDLVEIIKDGLKSDEDQRSMKRIDQAKNRVPNMVNTSVEALVSISTPRGLELYARLVLCELPQCEIERTRDTIHIFCGDGTSLLFTPEGFEVRIESMDWVTTSETMPTSRLVGRYTFRDLFEQKKLKPEYIIGLLHEAAEFRKSENKECKFCKKLYPPERRYSEDVCYGCARTHLGIIF